MPAASNRRTAGRSSAASSSTPRHGRCGRRSTTRPPRAILFPELRLGPAAPPWPAAATTRSARARLGLLREDARVESLEARPESRFRLRVTRVRLRERVELAARAGRRRHAGHPRRHLRAVRPLDGDPRPPRPGVAGEPGGEPPAHPEGTGRGGPTGVQPRDLTRRPTDRPSRPAIDQPEGGP